LTVELGIKNPLPSPEIQPALRDGNHDFTAKKLAFDMGVAVVFSGPVMAIAFQIVGRDFFKKAVKVLDQPIFIIIDVNACGDVHRIHKTKTFLDAAIADRFLHLICNIHVVSLFLGLKIKIFGVCFHQNPSLENTRRLYSEKAGARIGSNLGIEFGSQLCFFRIHRKHKKIEPIREHIGFYFPTKSFHCFRFEFFFINHVKIRTRWQLQLVILESFSVDPKTIFTHGPQ